MSIGGGSGTVNRISGRMPAYILAIVAPILAAIGKDQLNKAVDGDVGFVFAFAAVVVVALIGGLGPGVVATLTAAALDVVLFQDPVGTPWINTPAEQARTALFILDGLLLSWLAEIAKRGRRASDGARTDAETQRRSADAAIARLESLQELTARLSRATTTEEVAAAVLEHGRRTFGPTGGAVYVLTPDGVALRAVDSVGYDLADVQRWRLIPIDTPVPAAEVVRDGEPIVVEQPALYRQRFPHARSGDEPLAGALVMVPLRGGGQLFGTVGWWWARPRTIDAGQRDTLDTIASLTSQALDRARLFEAERGARRESERVRARTEAFQGLAAALARAATVEDVLGALTSESQRALASRTAVVGLLTDGGASFEIQDIRGHPAYTGPSTLSIDAHLPLTDAARDGIAIHIADPESYSALYPDPMAPTGTRSAALAAVPLRVGDDTIGAIGWAFESPRPWSSEDIAFCEAIARLGAQAVERARLLESERVARDGAERARRRTAVLAEAGRALGLSLEYEATVQDIAGLALPTLGDHCIVDIVGDPPQRLVAAIDPAELADVEVVRRRPVDMASDNPIARVIRDGRPLSIELGDDVLERVSKDPQHLAALRRFDLGRALIVPLLGHAGTMGAMLFGTRDPARRYDDDDVVMAQALAQRVARAIENVRLHLEVRRLAEVERDRAHELESVIASIGEGIVVLDQEGDVRSINAAAVRLLDGSVGNAVELAARVGGGLVLEPDEEGQVGPSEHLVTGADARWVEVTAYPIGRPETRPAFVCVIRDVTAFRQGQGLREAFLSLLSHELRTPVTTIYAGATVLGRPSGGLTDELRAEILADVGAEADRLYRLVEDLLVLARFDEGIPLGLEPNLLQRLVPQVVEQEQGRWPHVQFEISAAADLPTVSGDETAIVQVIRNLCTNAAKYSPVGSTIEVRLDSTAEAVRVRVLDRGSGIREQEAAHLFDPFYRSPATAAMAGGAGIGLYVCRRLVDAMGGQIWGRPRPDGGSEFGIELPRYGTSGDEDLDPDDRLAASVPATEG